MIWRASPIAAHAAAASPLPMPGHPTQGVRARSGVRLRMRLLTAIVASLLLVACGSGVAKPAGSSYADASALATKLGCTDFADTKPGPGSTEQVISLGPDMTSDAGGCTLNGQHVKIEMFADGAHLAQYMGFAKSFGCAMAKQFGITTANVVTGANWYVAPGDNLDAAAAQAMATTLGGAAQVIHC